jgi:hypothetical protein
MTDFSSGVDLGSAWAAIRLDGSELQNDLNKAKKSLSDSLKSMGDQISSVGMTALKIAAPIDAFFGIALKAAADSNKEIAQLGAVLASTHGMAGVTKEAALDLADALEHQTNFTKEAVLEGENMLLTFTSISKDVFPDATKTALNMSQALGQDMKSSAIQLGKALNDPIQGVTALRRVGVQFTDAQEKQIKTLVESGHLMDAQSLILKELNTEFGGSAEAAVAADGGFTQLQNSLHDMVVTVGNDLMPVFTDLVGQIKPIIAQVTDWISKNPQLVEALAIGAAVVTGLGIALVALGQAISAIGAISALVGGEFLATIGAPLLLVAGIVGAFALAWQNDFLGIRETVAEVAQSLSKGFEWISEAVGWFIDDVKQYGVIDAILGLFGLGKSGEAAGGQSTLLGIARTMGDMLTSVVDTVAEMVPDMVQAFSDLLGAVGDWLGSDGPGQLFLGLGSLFLEVAQWIADTGWGLFQTGIETLWTNLVNFVQSDGVSRFLGGLGTLINNAADWVIDTAIPQMLDTFVDMIADIVKFFTGDGSKQMQGGFEKVVRDVANWIINTGIPMAVDAFDKLVAKSGEIVQKITGHIVKAVTDALAQIPGLGSYVGVAQNSQTIQQSGASPFDIFKATINAIGMEHHADGHPITQPGCTCSVSVAES